MTASAITQIADMEDFVVPAENALYGSEQLTDGDTVYTQNVWSFENNWNATWASFAGFAFSNVTDNTTPGFGNQFSAIPGAGCLASTNYAVCYATPFNNHRSFRTGSNPIGGAYFTNTTYAYFSMLDGDAFAKKFGEDTSATGTIDGTNGEDWFLLTIYALGADSVYTGDSVNFYLADYRFAADPLDYIIDDWTWVDLSPLGSVHGLDFVLSSSDTSGGFGMNTPAYFAVDNLTGEVAEVSELSSLEMEIFPNPASSEIFVQSLPGARIQILDILGRILYSETSDSDLTTVALDECPAGLYVVRAERNGIFASRKLVVR